MGFGRWGMGHWPMWQKEMGIYSAHIDHQYFFSFCRKFKLDTDIFKSKGLYNKDVIREYKRAKVSVNL